MFLPNKLTYYALCILQTYLGTIIKSYIFYSAFKFANCFDISFHLIILMTTLKQSQVLLTLFGWGKRGTEHSMTLTITKTDCQAIAFSTWWLWVSWMVALEEAKSPSSSGRVSFLSVGSILPLFQSRESLFMFWNMIFTGEVSWISLSL